MGKFKYIGAPLIDFDGQEVAVNGYGGLMVKHGDIVELDEPFIEKATKHPWYEAVDDAVIEDAALLEEIEAIEEEAYLREKAKALGIKSYHNKKLEKLVKEIESLEDRDK